jgi:hypothetical protein
VTCGQSCSSGGWLAGSIGIMTGLRNGVRFLTYPINCLVLHNIRRGLGHIKLLFGEFRRFLLRRWGWPVSHLYLLPGIRKAGLVPVLHSYVLYRAWGQLTFRLINISDGQLVNTGQVSFVGIITRMRSCFIEQKFYGRVVELKTLLLIFWSSVFGPSPKQCCKISQVVRVKLLVDAVTLLTVV